MFNITTFLAHYLYRRKEIFKALTTNLSGFADVRGFFFAGLPKKTNEKHTARE
jgi:hypothetical protein